MASDYRVKTVKATGEPDQYGVTNYWVGFEGHQNDVLIRAKNAPEVGGMEYGTVSQETSKAGKQYFKFKREQKDGGNFHSEAPSTSFKGKPKSEYVDHHESIKAQWAIGQALSKFKEGCYECSGADRVTLLSNIEDFAKELYEMSERVAGNDPKEQRGIEGTGYDVAKATADQIKERVAEATDSDVADFDFEEPIDLSQIPF